MVYRENAKKDFSERLGLACDGAEVRRRGRAVDIQKMLQGKNITASTTAIGKWLNADSVPDLHNMLALAECLSVNAAWLEYGEGPMRPDELADSKVPADIAALFNQVTPKTRSVLEQIKRLEREGRLKDEDIATLNAIVELINKRK